MQIRCRSCQAVLAGYELSASGGRAIGFPASKAYESMLEEVESFDGTEPHFLCRYLDGYPCADCGTVELSVLDPGLMLKFDGQEWPTAAPDCPVCKVACRGPRDIDIDGTPGRLLAHLAINFGAPLQGRLCQTCRRVWLSLEPDDTEGRQELAQRFENGGPCSHCSQGRLRRTRLDAPHAGVVQIGAPTSPERTRTLTQPESELGVSICDFCGEAAVLLANPKPKAKRRKR